MNVLKLDKAGRGIHYVLRAKPAKNRTNRPSPPSEKSAKNRTNRPSAVTTKKPHAASAKRGRKKKKRT